MIRVLFSSVLVSLMMSIASMNAVAVIETYEFSTPELELRYTKKYLK